MKKYLIAKNVILLIIIVLSYSCLLEEPVPTDTVIAKVNDKYLYKNDLQKFFRQKNVSEQDSLVIVRNYIENWVKEQLMLSRAELNLSEEEKDVQEKLMNYRNSLIIYKYQDQYLKKNLDTAITYNEIIQYYNENTQNFELDNNLVKALYVKIADSISYNDRYNLIKLLRSSKEEDQQELYKYCLNNAETFDNFNNDWVIFNMIQSQFPRKINRPESTLKWNKFFETKDSAYYYYLKINDFVPESEITPLDFIDDKIRTIILNKRKITMIKKLEKDVYNDALNHDQVIIY